MHEAISQTIRDSAAAVAGSQAALAKAISENRDPNGAALDLSQKIPETDFSLSDLDAGIASLVTFLENLHVADAGIIVPRSFLDNVATKAAELKTQIDQLAAVFSTIVQEGGVKSIDKAAFHITTQTNAEHTLTKVIRRISSALDSALVAWFQLQPVVRIPDINDFGRTLRGISEQHSALSKLVEDVVQVGNAIKEDKKKIVETLGQGTQERGEIARLLEEVVKDRKTLSEYSAEGTEKIASIRNTHQDATKLDASVKDYQGSFSRFDDQLKGREERFQKENTDLDSIRVRLAENEEKIVGITNQAEGMLRGATNAGLAASFSSLQREINSELKLARYSFYFSICLLIVLSVPIALYVFPGLQALLKTLTGIEPGILAPTNAEKHTTPEVIAQVAARALLLVPGIWLVRFTSARHERLFRLREHYAYKYSVASSVEGFKKQAPDLEQGIAAATFYELTFNPATRMDANSTESRHPNPVMEYIMKRLEKFGDGQKKA